MIRHIAVQSQYIKRNTQYTMYYKLILTALVLLHCVTLVFTQSISIPLTLTKRSINTQHQHYKSWNQHYTITQYNLDNIADEPTGSMHMYNYYNRLYTGQISLGTPEQLFNVVLDTGSADMWVFSKSTQHQLVPYLHYYDSESSTTYNNMRTNWMIQYGKGYASGVLCSDTMTIAGYTVENQIFAETTNFSVNFNDIDEPLDGIVGLGYTQLSVSGAATLMDNLIQQKLITHKLFSFILIDHDIQLYDNNNIVHSKFVIGEPDLTYAPNGLTYINIMPDLDMWLLHLDSIHIDHQRQHSICTAKRPCAALLDTGTSFIGLPESLYQQFIHSIIQARPDCSIQDTQLYCTLNTYTYLPTLSFYLNHIEFYLEPVHYMIGNVLGVMSIESKSNDLDWIILGDTFIKTYYTVFDMDNNRIGLATPVATDMKPHKISALAIVLLCVTSSVLLTVIVYLLNRRYRKSPVSVTKALYSNAQSAPNTPISTGRYIYTSLNTPIKTSRTPRHSISLIVDE